MADRGAIVWAMSGAAVRPIWCTTCGDYVRPGTHGIHTMRFTAGAEPSADDEPATNNAAVVLLIVLAMAGSGALLIASAAMLLRRI